MQIISGAIDLIEQKLDPPKRLEVRPFTQGALESVGRAMVLSRKILGFSRTEAAIDERVDLEAALSEIEKPIRWLAGPGICVEMVFKSGIAAVFCNVRDLEDAVFNLVANAKDAMPDGGRLRIAVDRIGRGRKATVELRVTDTGCGMVPEVAKRAFQPHFTTKPAGRGNGLGLATVHDFACRVGGSAQIESAVNQGTSVILRIPAFADRRTEMLSRN